MKNLGGLKYCLGIKVTRSNIGIFLSQWKYILGLLEESSSTYLTLVSPWTHHFYKTVVLENIQIKCQPTKGDIKD